MSENYWYVDQAGNRRGPISEEEIAEQIKAGAIGRETLVWSSGMNGWQPAVQTRAFFALFGPPPLGPGLPPPPNPGAPPPTGGALHSEIPVWGLFGRALLVLVAVLSIVFSPWAVVSLYRWTFARISLPNGVRLKFLGRASGLWPIFILWALVVWMIVLIDIALRYSESAAILQAPLWILQIVIWILQFSIVKWVYANLSSEDDRLRLRFDGGFWAFVGWNVLLVLSFVLIIAWAWVLKYMMRWLCAHARGTVELEFTGSGLAILWRTVVFALLCAVVLPIPWALRWQTRWLISQIAVK